MRRLRRWITFRRLQGRNGCWIGRWDETYWIRTSASNSGWYPLFGESASLSRWGSLFMKG